MSVAQITRDARHVMISRATWGGSQNFLGARWVEQAVGRSPARLRKHIALRFLALSPHYFYARDLRAEDARNRASRQRLAEELVLPRMVAGARVLDYGCGPGYLAYAVAAQAGHVDAVDISRGVLACARALNARPNISYQTPDEYRCRGEAADLAYSFAVIQHLRADALSAMLSLLAGKVRAGGQLLLHFAEPDARLWRTEAQWLAGSSLTARARLRYGLNCFGRPASELAGLVAAHGFTDVSVQPLRGQVALPGDDIGGQHLLTACRA